MTTTIYPHCRYWSERKSRRNLARERIMRKARAEAEATHKSVDLILIEWKVRPRCRGMKIIEDDWSLGKFA